MAVLAYIHNTLKGIENSTPMRTVKRSIYLLTILVVAGTALSPIPPDRKPDPRPNIIYIMADDLGFSDIGCYGGEVHTPNLDALASGGMKLRTFYNNTRCCPTRASLLTGRYPHEAGMGHMVTLANAKYEAGPYQGFIDPSFPTIAEELRKAGYGTYMSGKWHVGERREHWPRKRGFDRYFGLISGASSFYEVTPAERSKRFYALDDADYEIPSEGYYATDAFTDHAIDFLSEHRRKRPGTPFFLYLAYTAPHFPLHALEPDIAKYEKRYEAGWDSIRARRYRNMQDIGYADSRYTLTPRTKGIPDWQDQADKAQWVRRMAVYAAMTDRMDQNIGRLVAALKANGSYENTLIVFLSDNGGCAETVSTEGRHDPSKRIGEKGSYSALEEPWANVSNTPFRMYKHFMHEGGIASPGILHWPARIRPKKGFSDGIGHVMDLMPTALELAGANMAGLPGRSLSYLWSKKPDVDRTYCWEHEGNKAIREGRWKLVREFDDAGWQLFDMKADPAETNDLAAKDTARASRMLQTYLAWERRVGVREFKGKRYGMEK
jgi:arylsulfatase A-like enzyme